MRFYLNTRWKQTLSLLDKRREKFVRPPASPEPTRFEVTLVESEPDRFTPTKLNPVGRSGQFVLDIEAHFDTVKFPFLPIDPPK